MTIVVGIHETATPGSSTTFSLTASGVLGELRVSDRFVAGQGVQCVLKSQDSNKYEEGWYVAAASNQLTRSKIVNNHLGTTAAVDFASEAVDVRASPVTGGVEQMLPAISSSAPIKGHFSDHLHDGGDNQTLVLLKDRVHAVPFIPRCAGAVEALRDEFTSVSGATYRWSIRTTDPSDGRPGIELWQSGDLTTALTMTSNAVSPNIETNGAPLWLLLLHTHSSNPSIRAGNRNYSGPSQLGLDDLNMRHSQFLYADITPSGNVIPASITWDGQSAGSAPMPALVYA